MQTFITIVGWLTVVLICAAALAFAVALAADLCRRALERFEWAVGDKVRHELGRSIHASAHWFGECQDTALAIKMLGDRLIRQGCADSNEWREAWRGAIKQRETRKAEAATRTE